MEKFKNIEQQLIELMSDYLDSKEVVIEEACAGITDPEPKESTTLHVRMANAALIEYKKTMVSLDFPK